MKLLFLLNSEKAFGEEVKKYSLREAARAIIVDNDGKIALLHVVKSNYYKLPGGGIENGEDNITALKRECLEEVGSDIEILGEIGQIIEYRKIFNLKQISYCYLAKLKGKKGMSKFTSDEIEDDFEQVWLNYKDARRALTQSSANTIEGSAYIVPRDTAFLEEAKSYLMKDDFF